MIDDLYLQVETEIFAADAPYNQLSFPNEGGVTAYFGRNLTTEDLAVVKEFLVDQKLFIENTRAFKEGEKLIVTVGSINADRSQQDIDFKGRKFDLVFGEFAPYMKECNLYLKEAVKYCSNDNQK